MTETSPLYLVTPLLESRPMKQLTGLDVFLKLENLQPPGSFKCRGISNQCKKAKARGCKVIVCASGGNAGLAAAYSAQALGIPAKIVLPQSTPTFVAEKLSNHYGAEVEIHGIAWDDANKYALEICEQAGYEYIHPFDNPEVWEGHTSIMKEVSEQMQNRKPDLVVLSVGGGGLLCGIAQGMDEVGWMNVPILCMETEGADCFNRTIKAGTITTIPSITSVAICLGAKTPCERSFQYQQEKPLLSIVVKDRDAINACLQFAGNVLNPTAKIRLVIEKKIVTRNIDSVVEAIDMALASSYVLNMSYGNGLIGTLEFIQRCLVNLNPSKGSKSARQGHTVPAKVLSFINALNAMDWNV